MNRVKSAGGLFNKNENNIRVLLKSMKTNYQLL